MSEKRVLVTGAAGFVGMHASRYLKQQGHLVVGLDNFNPYYAISLKRARSALLQEEGIHLYEGDINDRKMLEELFDRYRFTHLLHLAAQAGVRYGESHPEAYVSANLTGFATILEFARAHAGLKLIFASSSSIYGLNEKIPFSETDRTDHPASFYAATKKAGELMAFSYHHNYAIPMTALRFFTVYGPWGRPDMAYYSFSEAILTGKPITLFNQGQMERDFTFIEDILPAIDQSLERSGRFESYNLGNHRPEKVMTLISILEEALGKKAIIELAGPKKGEVLATFADVQKAKQQLGFHPKTALATGLKAFLAWYLPYRSAR